MSKSYAITKEIKGKKYTAQFAGLSTALRAVDESYIDGTSNTSLLKMAKFLFEYIIVEPKGLSVDDFVDMEEFQEVVKFAREVMQGDFREEANEGTTNKKGSK